MKRFIFATIFISLVSANSFASVLYDNGSYVNGGINSISAENSFPHEPPSIGPHWMAEDFSLSSSSTLTGFTFNAWTLQGTPMPSSVEWAIYSNNNGTPGTVIFSGVSTDYATKLTGTRQGGMGTFDLLDYTISLDNKVLSGGAYWLGLHVNASIERSVAWSISLTFSNIGYQDTISKDGGNTWQTSQYGHTYNFRVLGWSGSIPDTDGDGIPDSEDICSGGDDNVNTDGDSVPDFCDACPLDAANDADEDTICGDVDNCPLVANTDQADADGDGVGNACNEGDDNDGDEWSNELDNCPNTANPTQADIDEDGMGDACDSCPLDAGNDADVDGVCGDVDNCPIVANSDQADTPDSDGEGNACDLDDDNDGFVDDVDNCPLTYNDDQWDYDSDGEGDACDDDVDGDNVNDAVDACLDTAPGALVDGTGCALVQLCPCDNTWKNHGAYVKCVAHAANDFQDAGLISGSEHGDIVSEAANSSCGHKQ